MIETVFRCDELPRADRFDFWREQMAKLIAPMEMSTEHTGDFRGQVRILEVGPAHVWPTKFDPMTFRRTPKLIRQSDPELYHFSFLEGANLQVSQAREEAAHSAGGLYVVDTSRPYDCVAFGGPPQGVGLEIPKALIPVPHDRIDRLLARPIPGREGVGALLTGFLSRLSADSGSYRPADGPRLGAVLVDLATAVLAHAAESDDAVPPETRQRTLFLRVQNFIQRNLHDPQLTPAAVAAAHHISVSYLHRLFRAEDTTVSAWIRRQRLDRVRRDLDDPGLSAVPLHELAARRGFSHPAVFSRVFRAAYGMPPSDYRQLALRSRAPDAPPWRPARGEPRRQTPQPAGAPGGCH
ncbi:helix-turn-helix domain-containing protein [Streptomyces sp. NBRC 110028]|uniref:helix-turn-helix domain-containing protein n=1 Tax=Streptomyces sp. NBRC 110028 TaxID=1621260 RepID=UPI0007C83A2C|nr:helix-turn-helix domain-containing protein [Streptomyces sp. NBRC 110028]